MSYVNPDKNINIWLRCVLLDLLEQNTKESLDTLKEGIILLASLTEAGLIEQAFPHWIATYRRLLAEHESNQSSSHQRNADVDSQESQE